MGLQDPPGGGPLVPGQARKLLYKEVKLLRKKLARSEANRRQAEDMKDQTDALYRNLMDELAAQKAQMEHLSGQLGRYLSPQVYYSIFSGEKDVSSGPSAKSSRCSSRTSRISPQSLRICSPRI